MIVIQNVGDSPWTGWTRLTIPSSSALAESLDKTPTPRLVTTTDGRTAEIAACDWMRDLRVVEVRVPSGVAGGGRVLILDDIEATPASPVGVLWQAWPAGDPTINGVRMVHMGTTVFGARVQSLWRLRVGPLLCVDVHILWYPGDHYAECAAKVTASNLAVPDLTDVVPPGGLVFTWGDAVVIPLGAPPTASLVPGGTRFGDGQARRIPFTVVWLTHASPAEFANVRCLANRTVWACGVDRLYADGNPSLTPALLGDVNYGADRYLELLAGLHNWNGVSLGIAKRSANAGEQEDQLVHGEMLAAPVNGAVNYLAALKWANWPCHHLDWTGNIVRAADHPNMVVWEGRAIFSTSPTDTLGKSRPLDTVVEAEGWSGPDQEHWLIGRLYEAARQTGADELEDELLHHAQLMLGSLTLPIGNTAGWFTSTPGAARAVGYKAMVVERLYYALRNRRVADELRQRWADVLRLVLLPSFEGKDVWDIRVDDARLGPGAWWLPWQQAVGAYGVYLASRLVLDVDADLARRGVAMAQLAAQAVLRDGYVRDADGSWRVYPQRPVGPMAMPPDATFLHFGMPLALATILSEFPTNSQAREAWDYTLAQADTQHKRSWLVPIAQPRG